MRRLFRHARSAVSIASAMCAALVSFGCNRTPQLSEIPGTYVANQGFATDRLDLLPDHTFRQEIWVRAGGQRYVTNGIWEFDSRNGEIIFSGGFLDVRDEFGRPRQQPAVLTGLVIESIVKRSGQVRIAESSPDYWNDAYHKQDLH